MNNTPKIMSLKIVDPTIDTITSTVSNVGENKTVIKLTPGGPPSAKSLSLSTSADVKDPKGQIFAKFLSKKMFRAKGYYEKVTRVYELYLEYLTAQKLNLTEAFTKKELDYWLKSKYDNTYQNTGGIVLKKHDKERNTPLCLFGISATKPVEEKVNIKAEAQLRIDEYVANALETMRTEGETIDNIEYDLELRLSDLPEEQSELVTDMVMKRIRAQEKEALTEYVAKMTSKCLSKDYKGRKSPVIPKALPDDEYLRDEEGNPIISTYSRKSYLTIHRGREFILLPLDKINSFNYPRNAVVSTVSSGVTSNAPSDRFMQ